jgi:hypothetical protein
VTTSTTPGAPAQSGTGPHADSATDRLDDDGAPPAANPGNASLQWATDATDSGADGTWRRRSRDAAAELSELIPAVSARIASRVTRVSLNIEAWDGDHPRRLQQPDGVVRLGWFHLLDPGTVTLGHGMGSRIVLRILDAADTDGASPAPG